VDSSRRASIPSLLPARCLRAFSGLREVAEDGGAGPCKGRDPHLRENIRAWLAQDYPDFHVVFVVESEEDPALIDLQEVKGATILIAGKSTDCGQKVHSCGRRLSGCRRNSRLLHLWTPMRWCGATGSRR